MRGPRAIFHSRDRLVALTDGVFAVAITLLGFDIVAAGRDAGTGGELGPRLLEEWPVFAAYLVGFLTILVCWINHQVVYEHVKRMDTGLIWINGLQIALVAAVPVPTAILAANLQSPDGGLAFVIYGVTFFLMALSFYATSTYIARRGLADDSPDRGVDRALQRCYAIAVLWAAASIAVSLASLVPALVMWALMFALFAFPLQFAHAVRGRLLRQETPAAG